MRIHNTSSSAFTRLLLISVCQFLFPPVMGFAVQVSGSYAVNLEIAAGSYLAPYVDITGAPANAIITSVEAKFDYIAYGVVQNYVSVRFNRGSDPGSSGGASMVSQGSLPAGNPGTYPVNGYVSFSNWNGQAANARYYFRYAVAAGSPYTSTLYTIYVRVTYIVPPSPPNLSSPSDYGIFNRNQTSSITHQWSSVSGATAYWLNVFPSGDSAHPKFNGSVGNVTSYALSTSGWSNGEYTWLVRAGNAAGWSGDSTSRRYIADTPPSAPSISAPANGSSFNLGSSTSFSWTGPAGVTIDRYYLRIVPGADFQASPAYDSELPETTTSQSITFNAPPFAAGSHIWSVRAIKVTPSNYSQSAYETTIGWGSYAPTRTFTVTASPPSPPSLVSPSDRSIYRRDVTTSISFKWSSVSGALEYRLNVFPSGSASTPVFDGSAGNVTTYSLNPNNPQIWANNVYIWQVKVRTAAGWSDYSNPARQFIVDTPPGAPTVSAPANGSSFNLGSSTSFSWTGPAGVTIDRYYLRIVPGADFQASPAYDPELPETTTSQSVTFNAPPFAAGSHIWSVRAIKSVPPGYEDKASEYETTIGWGGYDLPHKTFTLQALPDFIVESVNGPSTATAGQTVDVTVSARNRGLNPTQTGNYVMLRVILSPDQEINQDDLVCRNYQVPLAEWANGATVTRTFSYDIAPDVSGAFYWGAYVDVGESEPYWDESNEHNNALAGNSVQIQSGPSLISPADHSTVTATTLTFQWGAVPNATSYDILADNNSGFGSPEISLADCQNTTYTINNYLSDNVYNWKVRAKFANGSYTAWSEPWQFTYHLPVLPAPVLVPLYRLYTNDQVSGTRDHFYTANPSEKANAISQKGYKDEGIECFVSDRNFPGAAPLYRLYWGEKNSHCFTTSEGEKDAKIIQGYFYEGIACFLYANSGEALVPVHRLRESLNTYHYFVTTEKGEYQNATNALGYIDDAIIGYVTPTGIKDPIAHSPFQGNYGGVDLGSGALRGLNSLDLTMKGGGPSLALAHYYNSFNSNPYPMGPGWSHSLDSYAKEDVDGSVSVYWGNGTISFFLKTGSAYEDKMGNNDQLALVDDGVNYGYSLRRKDQTVYGFRKININPISGGFLQDNCRIVLRWITDWRGNTLAYKYEAAYGTLQSVGDNFGRSLRVEYLEATPQHVRRVYEMVDGVVKRQVSFTYNPDGTLATFTDARGKITSYTYNADKYLTGIIYPKGNTVAFGYDDAKRVNSIKADNDPASMVAYNPALNTTEVTDPQNKVFEFSYSDFRLQNS